MKLRVQVEGRSYEVEVEFLDSAAAGGNEAVELRPPADDPIPASVLRPRPPQKLAEDSVCRSPIAGRVATVVVEAGGQVRRNQPVIVLDAMKMEVPIGPVVDGTVKAIHVAPGDSVQAGQLLFDLC